jgi:hypothetical protein
VGLVSRAAKVSGSKGIMLDTESYGANPWKYDSASYGGKSFAEVQSMVRKRGAQWMSAVQSEYPNITVYGTFLMSMPMLNTGGDASQLSSMDYALLPAFENGMIDALSTDAKIVDGNEATYYYRDTDWFFEDSNRLKNPPAGWIAPENLEKYKRQVQVGTAVWVEASIYSSSFTDDYRSKWWQHQIYNSLATADEYVFFFTLATNWNQNPFWASIAGPAKDGFLAAKKKYSDGIPLGYDMHTDYQTYRRAEVITVPSNIVTTPSVSIASGSGTRLKAPATLKVTAAASGSDVSRIEFYLDGTKSGVVYGSSREYTWNNLQPGTYEVIARIYDSQGNHGTSAPIYVIVDP